MIEFGPGDLVFTVDELADGLMAEAVIVNRETGERVGLGWVQIVELGEQVRSMANAPTSIGYTTQTETWDGPTATRDLYLGTHYEPEGVTSMRVGVSLRDTHSMLIAMGGTGSLGDLEADLRKLQARHHPMPARIFPPQRHFTPPPKSLGQPGRIPGRPWSQRIRG